LRHGQTNNLKQDAEILKRIEAKDGKDAGLRFLLQVLRAPERN
jgi:hypothetical protein